MHGEERAEIQDGRKTRVGGILGTYVLSPQEIKFADSDHGIGFKTVKAKGGS